MGYRAEKEKIENKIRVIKLIALYIVLALMLGLCIFSAFCPPIRWKYYVKKPNVSKRVDGEMRIHFLDVGQGDCTVIELPDGKVAMIDGGDTSDVTAKAVLRYLNALKIKTIDYLIVTHPDSDHCGSLKKVLQQKDVLNAYLPAANPEKTGATYAEVYQQLLEEDCKCIYAESGETFGSTNAGYTFTCLYPYVRNEWSNPYNGESTVVWLDYMGTSAIFMGDATWGTERELMSNHELGLLENLGVDLSSTEILKVGHHGSNSSTSLEFLEYLNVKASVISCGENNPYGHPVDEVLQNITQAGSKTYRTDCNGTVMISVKDGEGFAVKTEK